MVEHIVQDLREAEDIAFSLIQDAAPGDNPYNIALSGGRSIVPVLRALERLHAGFLGKCRFFLADERIGRDFNQEMLNDRLFNILLDEGKIAQEQLIFPDIELAGESAAMEYAGHMEPLHLVFLGMGEDGHIASLFPHHPVLASEKIVDYISDSPKPPPERITMTYRAFSLRTVIVLLVLGSEKKEAYDLFLRTDDYKKSPAAYFKKSKHLHIIYKQGG